MDESTIFAMSVARAVEADAALIEELRLEDQIARDRMMAETLETDPEAIIEPYQSAIDEETFETLRHFNVITTSNAEETDSGEERTTDGTQNDQEAQQIQLAAHTGDIQEDTVVGHDTSDGTSGDNQTVNDWQTPDLENDAQGTNTVQDCAWWTTDESAQEQQEPDDPGEVPVQEQERDTAQNVLTAVEESAAPAQPTDILPVPDMKQCVSCQDDFPETFEAPCSHHWCQSCLALCFESSFRNKSRFPPRCCGHLPVEVGDFITQEMVDNFQKKEVEFSTKNPTYCSDAAYAAFIPPQSIEGGIGRCPECEKQTCVPCKQPLHEGICPEDSAAQEVLRLGEAEGWQRCEECKHLIDLKIGCFHITCPCGHQFCYLCGARWKTCTCPQWEENRLVEAAGQRVVNARERVRRELRAARCHHQRCERIDGPRDCNECHQTLQIFLLRCERCNVELCFRCLTRVRAERP